MLFPSPSWSAQFFTDKYDAAIQSAVHRYWVAFPHWRAAKAQLYQESALNPDAQSGAGAKGLGQFMGPTWAEVTRQIGLGAVDRRDAAASILAFAYYQAKLDYAWRSPRPELDRHHLGEASYNAGLGSILKAQAACGNPPLYDAIMACLPQITGAQFSKETLGYAPHIDRWWAMMEASR